MTEHREAKDILADFYKKESVYLSPGGGDFSVVACLLSPDCVMHQAASLPYGGEWKGPDGFKAWLEAFGAVWSKLDVVESEMRGAGDVVFSRIKAEAVARATGRAVAFEVLQCVRCADGRIAEFRPFYWDIPALLRALD